MSEFRFDGSVAEFDLYGVGEDTNTTYMGIFKVKTIVTPYDYIRADRLYRELLGQVNPHLASKEAQNYAFALSQLKVRVLESPDFFKNKDIDGAHLDRNILIQIINLAIDAQEEYKKTLTDKLKNMQKMLADKIKNKQIIPEETNELVEDDSEEDLPEMELDDEN